MPSNYDSIAKVYDQASRLVYGRQIVVAQVWLLEYIPTNSKILIVGGGTGWILEEIAKKYSEGLEIDYLESSAQMLILSRKRNCKNNVVNYIHQPVEFYVSVKQYDVIITPFLFDNFPKEAIDLVFEKLSEMLKDKGRWLFADFIYEHNKSSLWQGFLLHTMYFFFRLVSQIETQTLIDMKPYFTTHYRIEMEEFFYSGFIRSAVYRKGS